MNKVFFAETGKDFVDILFSFLTLPLGTIARLVQKESNIGPLKFGCVNSLYHSVEGLQLGQKQEKSCYCNQGTHRKTITTLLNLTLMTPTLPSIFYIRILIPPSFVVTDDLIVMPNTADYITSFALLQNLGIESISSVKEMTLNFPKDKVPDLLKCSLFSQSCLTNLFLEKKPNLQMSRFLYGSFENSGGIQINLKLFIRKADAKILFAIGGKDFADMLLSFLTFPLGGVVRKLGGTSHLGSIDGLYKSVADLDENIHFNSKDAKNKLFDPHLLPFFKLTNQILPMLNLNLRYYCYHKDETIVHLQYSIEIQALNTGCGFKEMLPINPESPAEGFVNGTEMYVATDDLVLAPFSLSSSLKLLSRLNTLLGDVTEKVVTIGFKECLSLLKASLTSTSALNDGLGHLLKEVKTGEMRTITVKMTHSTSSYHGC
ncbi:hypothetical protein Fmac_001184 [Flemingia macrophylla]|uniref:BPI2 domain-containing protein n=1 Tax=Flemingia macrophylla TaxID=520843 RepID=A0ABD1NGE9_9FABA